MRRDASCQCFVGCSSVLMGEEKFYFFERFTYLPCLQNLKALPMTAQNRSWKETEGCPESSGPESSGSKSWGRK